MYKNNSRFSRKIEDCSPLKLSCNLTGKCHAIGYYSYTKRYATSEKQDMIHLIVGNTGSGKTTYSNELKRHCNGIIFSIDKWNKTLFLADKKPTDGLEWFLERIERAEEMILDLVLQLENSKTDSILDLGLSKFEHREKFRKFADLNGYQLTLHFLDIPKDIRLSRVMTRNTEKGETFEFEVSKENFDFMETWFEKPTEKELIGGIIIKE